MPYSTRSRPYSTRSRHGAFALVHTAEEDEVAYISRWFSHTGIRIASDLVITAATGQPKRPDVTAVALLRKSPQQPVPDKLLLVAETFAELQDRRHEADYSNDYDPVRYSTLEHIASADVAIRASWSMWRAGESPHATRLDLHDSYHRFLQLALLKSGGPRSR